MDKQEWNGEGLPPVGCECEFESAEVDTWVSAKVIGYDGPACVVALDGYGYAGSSEADDFRRSAEDRAVGEMMSVYQANTTVDARDAMRDIYRAIRDGKIPGVKLDK